MTDKYFEKPYWIVDILPKQVPKDSPGQYFAVEKYYMREPQKSRLRQKFAELLLKLNCYYDISVTSDLCGNWEKDPEPEKLVGKIMNITVGTSVYLLFEAEDTMAVINEDDAYMTVYGPPEELLETLKALAASEGLFVWKP